VAVVEFWLEFASTYSYPAAMRIGTCAREAGVAVRWRPFALGPIFKQQGLPLDSPFNWQPAKGRYMWRDVERLCAGLGLPFRQPDPFPQPSLLAARLAIIGLRQGWGEDFARAVYRAEFGEGRQIGDIAVMTDLLSELNVESAAVLAQAQGDEVKADLRRETEEAQRRGIFGAPTFVTQDGELFWGNDRLEHALAWAKDRAREDPS
jgi:2-hydroxychromene-2-carboxylate isomerase